MKLYTLFPALLFLGGCATQYPGPSPEAVYHQGLVANTMRFELDKLNARLNSARVLQKTLAKERTKQLAIQNSGNFTAPQQSAPVSFPRLEEAVELCEEDPSPNKGCVGLAQELNALKRRATQNQGVSVYVIGSDVSGPMFSPGSSGGRIRTEQVRPVAVKTPLTRRPVLQRPKTTGELVAGSINNFVNRSAGIVEKVAPAAIFGWTISQVADAPTNYIGGDDNAGRYTDQSSVIKTTYAPEAGE